MQCIECGADPTKVLDTRVFLPQPRWIKRRRKCLDCGHIFFTLEMPADDMELDNEEPTDAPAND